MKPTLGRLIALLAVAALTGVGCGDDGPDSSGDDRIHVVAAFYPLVFAAESVGGDLIEIENLTPPGVEPHDLELSANQVRSLTDADLVLYLGQGFQPAVEDAISGSDESRTLDALEGQNLAPNPDDEEEGPPIDPHVWLDPTLMAEIVDRVTDKLSEIDPDNADTYEENAADVDARLTALDEDFSAGLSDCERHEIVTSHAAFGYLAARYGLEQVSVSEGIDPEIEPSPARLAEVARFVEENGVTSIFFEELLPPDVAETIARETGAVTAELSPLESGPESGDYVDAMESTLAELTKALGCD